MCPTANQFRLDPAMAVFGKDYIPNHPEYMHHRAGRQSVIHPICRLPVEVACHTDTERQKLAPKLGYVIQESQYESSTAEIRIHYPATLSFSNHTEPGYA